MEGRERLVELLGRKEALFQACAGVTQALCVRPAGELAQLVARRQTLLDQAAALDLEIRALCVGDGAVRAAVNHTCPRGELPGELAQLYDASLAVKAAARRILRGEEAVRLRLESEREKAREGLEAINRSASSVAGRYGQSVETGVRRPFPGGREKKV